MGGLTDLRYAAKALARKPGTSAALLLTIALGIGGNAAVLAFITGFRGRTQPIVDRGQTVVSVFAQQPGGALDLLSKDDYRALDTPSEVFDLVAAAHQAVGAIRLGSHAVVGTIATVSPGARDLFGLPDSAGADAGVVLSARLAKDGIPASAAVRDASLTIDDQPVPILGSAPDWLEGLYLGRPIAAWRVTAGGSAPGDDGAGRTLSVWARLRPGLTLRAAQAALDAHAPPGVTLIAVPYTGLPPEATAGISRLTRLLSAAALIVFLIACANVAVFLLSSAASRSRDTAVRVALGAGRHVLLRSAVSEAALLLLVGGGAGLLIGHWIAHIIPALLFEPDAATLVFSPDLSAMLLSSVASAVIILACGLVPLLDTRNDRPAIVLRRPSTVASASVARLQTGLVILQTALCCAMLVAAGFVLDAFRATLRTSSNVRLDRALLATLEAKAGFARPDLGFEYFRDVNASIAWIPGVVGTAWAARLPGAEPSWQAVEVELPNAPALEVRATLEPFHPESLNDIVVPPQAGRMFSGGDLLGGCHVAIVSAAAAAAFGQRAVGRVIEDDLAHRFEIIGTVAMRPAARPSRMRESLVYYYPAQGLLSGGSEPSMVFRSRLPPASRVWLNAAIVSSGYFTMFGLPLRQGVLFGDVPPADGCRVAVVNRQAAQAYFGGQAVGGAIVDGSGRRTTIVAEVEEPPLRSTQRRVEPSIYLPSWQDYAPRLNLIVARSPAGPDESLLRQSVDGVLGGLGPASFVTLDAQLARTSLPAERVGAVLITAAAVNGLILAVLGLYRAATDDVLRRSREVAIRSALGAQRRRLMGLVLRTTGRWALQGGVLGLLLAVVATRWVRGVTGFVSAAAPWVWVTGPAILLVGVLLACILPMRRVLQVDPLTTMRSTD